MTNELGGYLGEGFRRVVYEHPDDSTLVVKVLKDPKDDHNRIEFENWQRLSGRDEGKWLAPCVELRNDGQQLIQKKVEVVDVPPHEVPEWLKILGDWKVGGNQTKPWGVYEGRLVIVDYGDQPLCRYLTEADFVEQVKRLKVTNPEHWGNEIGRPGQPIALERWSYHEKTVEVLKSLKPAKILEAGTMGIRVANDSDTIDTDLPEYGWRLTYTPTYKHDLSEIPWPIGNASYDVFVALRVFHHLANEAACLSEMERIAKHIILGVTLEAAIRYENIRKPDEKYHFDDTDTTILVYLQKHERENG